eukprot:240491-Alexandrium_andersonii.AAC.1
MRGHRPLVQEASTGTGDMRASNLRETTTGAEACENPACRRSGIDLRPETRGLQAFGARTACVSAPRSPWCRRQGTVRSSDTR